MESSKGQNHWQGLGATRLLLQLWVSSEGDPAGPDDRKATIGGKKQQQTGEDEKDYDFIQGDRMKRDLKRWQ